MVLEMTTVMSLSSFSWSENILLETNKGNLNKTTLLSDDKRGPEEDNSDGSSSSDDGSSDESSEGY